MESFANPQLYILVALVALAAFDVWRKHLSKAKAEQPDYPPGEALPDLTDAALTVVMQLARRKFPWLSEAEAIHRFTFESVSKHEAEEAAKVEAYVKATAPAPDRVPTLAD